VQNGLSLRVRRVHAAVALSSAPGPVVRRL